MANARSIQAKIAFTGPPPAPRKIIPTKDKDVCGGVREVPLITLAPDKGVEAVLVLLWRALGSADRAPRRPGAAGLLGARLEG